MRAQVLQIRWMVGLTVSILMAAVAVGSPVAAQASLNNETASEFNEPKYATFEGRKIDAKTATEIADSCTIWEDGSMECFRTRQASDMAHDEAMSQQRDGARAAGGCFAHLYTSPFYTGGRLTISHRGMTNNLVGVYNNNISSFRMGACNGTFWSGWQASGAVYPGSSSAFTWSSTMASGWNNRLSSVYIN